MTEADTESIWDTTLETARFALVGIRMAEILNFEVNDNATTQCTNTAILPILEQLSEECLIELIAVAKMNATTNPWDFISSNVSNFMSRKIEANRKLINKIKKIEGKDKTIEIVTRTL